MAFMKPDSSRVDCGGHTSSSTLGDSGSGHPAAVCLWRQVTGLCYAGSRGSTLVDVCPPSLAGTKNATEQC